MRKTRRHVKPVTCLLLAMLCLAGAFFAPEVIGAVGRRLYPRGYEEIVRTYAAEYGVEENIVYAVIRTESGFSSHAESQVGARGLMQITDETFEWIKSKIAAQEELSFDDMFDPRTNIRFGTYLLSVCLARYGNDLPTAAAAYHSGMGLVDGLLQKAENSQDGKTLSAFPYNQMNRYVYKIQKNYQKYCSLYAA